MSKRKADEKVPTKDKMQIDGDDDEGSDDVRITLHPDAYKCTR